MNGGIRDSEIFSVSKGIEISGILTSINHLIVISINQVEELGDLSYAVLIVILTQGWEGIYYVLVIALVSLGDIACFGVDLTIESEEVHGENVSTNHDCSHNNECVYSCDCVIEEIILHAGTSWVSLTIIVSLLGNLISVFIIPSNELITSTGEGRSRDPNSDSSDHEESEVLDGLDHINAMSEIAESFGIVNSLVGHIHYLRSGDIGHNGDSETPGKEKGNHENLPETKIIGDFTIESVHKSESFYETNGSINSLYCNHCRYGKSGNESHDITNIDNKLPLWCN